LGGSTVHAIFGVCTTKIFNIILCMQAWS